jgi:magnesium chelatase family protein
LDELTEFDRRVLDVLREPLESGFITISRAARQEEYPARAQLIAAMNPCPQGYDCDLMDGCRCSLGQQRRYRSRLSAPLIDRIDLQLEVQRLSRHDLDGGPGERGETSAAIRIRVIACRERQLARFGKPNAFMSNREVETACALSETNRRLLDQALEKFSLSTRAYHRILKVARTIADLADSDQISSSHLSEALSYRALDRWIAASN